MRFTLLTRRAERDLRGMSDLERTRLRQAIVGLEPATDVRPLKGRAPARRMRVDDIRVNRRDLDRAISSL